MGFVGNFHLIQSFQWQKNFENLLRFDEVTAMSIVAPFYVDMVYTNSSFVSTFTNFIHILFQHTFQFQFISFSNFLNLAASFHLSLVGLSVREITQ